ncbi:MAG TPA: hypothetical protein VMU04_01340 [Candidatus Acidoferrum sp.]|nr:hypothetical protein [Candidatus Acidoferrum sp.]
MKCTCSRAVLAASCLAAAAFTALAAPLQRAEVAGNPSWVAHVDFDGLRPTAIGQYILSEMDKPESQAKLAAFKAIVSVDLRTQLHGVTVYSTGTTPQDGVLLVYADFDADRLVTLAKAAHDSQNNTYKQHTIYNWIDDKKKAKNGVKPRVYAAIDGARVVFGQREERVAQALDVIDGTSPSLASTQSFPQLGATGDTSFLEGAATRFNLPSADPNAALLKLAQQGLLQLGASGDQLNGVLNLQAQDEEVAGHMASVAQGLIALMKLQQDKPETAKFAQGLTVSQDGQALTIKLSLPATDAVGMMKADAARKAHKKAAKEATD